MVVDIYSDLTCCPACGLELIIASMMIAVLIAGLATHLRGGISVWRRTQTAVDTLQREQVALDRLRRDVANAVRYDPRETPDVPPTFEPSAARWVTVVPGRAWDALRRVRSALWRDRRA